MKNKRARNFCFSSQLLAEDSNEQKRPRGRPCKPRILGADFTLKPQGEKLGPKRTPLHIGDPYAGFDSYEVESLLAQCFKHGDGHYKVTVCVCVFL